MNNVVLAVDGGRTRRWVAEDELPSPWESIRGRMDGDVGALRGDVDPTCGRGLPPARQDGHLI